MASLSSPRERDSVTRAAPDSGVGDVGVLRDTAQVTQLEPLAFNQRNRIRTAAYHAKRKYPGVIGELLSDELIFWEQFGYVLGPGRITDLVNELMRT